MKRVGLYIPDLSNGGAERVVSRLASILSDCYEVFVILNEKVIKYNVPCKIINMDIPSQSSLIKKVLLPLIRARKLKNIKKTYKIDCVISFLTSANIVNVLSSAKITSTVLSVRNFSEIEKTKSSLNKIKDFIMKLLYKKAEYVIPVSLALEISLVENYKIPRNKMKTIYNPYDIDEIAMLSKDKIKNVEHEKFLGTGKVFVTVGRLTYQKGYWHLIKALSLMNDYTDAKLLIIGVGENQDKIEQLIKDLKLEGKVLLAGYQKNPFQYISRCYAYVLSSLFEGFPNAMVEAMACKCPIIAADCKSGPREILFDEVDLEKEIKNIECADYGIIVPEFLLKENWDPYFIDDSDKLLAEAMNMLLGNEFLRNELGLKGQIRAKSFDYHTCLKSYTDIIENVK